MSKLTPRQQAFVDEYLIDLNATQAAIRAGYSEKTARSQGQRMLTNVDMEKAIQKAMSEREKRTEITQDKVLAQLAKIAFADLKDVVTWEMESVFMGFEKTDDNVRAVYEDMLKMRVKESSEVDGTILQEISERRDKNGLTHTVKLNDRMKALELIGKHLGMFDERQELLEIKRQELELKRQEVEARLNNESSQEDKLQEYIQTLADVMKR